MADVSQTPKKRQPEGAGILSKMSALTPPGIPSINDLLDGSSSATSGATVEDVSITQDSTFNVGQGTVHPDNIRANDSFSTNHLILLGVAGIITIIIVATTRG